MTTDIVSKIKAKVDPAAFDLTTAEGRVAFDEALRAELVSIRDIWLQKHAGELLKEWRHDLFGKIDHAEIHQLRDRIAAIEARLDIKQPVWVETKVMCQGGEDG